MNLNRRDFLGLAGTMALSSLSVIINSALLNRLKLSVD